jgi:riboflavin synthase
MFTGIITEIGTVKSLSAKNGVWRIEIECKKTASGIRTGDSVAVNGVCLSAVSESKTLCFDVVRNTFVNTDLKRLRPGDKVNLENAMKLGDNISGHLVSGHVDGERRIKKNLRTRSGWEIDIETLPGDEKYIILKGSVAIDGISLTIAEVKRGAFRIFLIPHTLGNTTLQYRRAGDHVNVEYDMMGKYSQKKALGKEVTMAMLEEKGFI